MPRQHVTLRFGSDNYVRLRKLNDNAVAPLPDDLPEDEPPPAPLIGSDVRFTIYETAPDVTADPPVSGVPFAGYDSVVLEQYGPDEMASYRALLADVELLPGHYQGEYVATHTDGRVTRFPALVSVSDD